MKGVGHVNKSGLTARWLVRQRLDMRTFTAMGYEHSSLSWVMPWHGVQVLHDQVLAVRAPEHTKWSQGMTPTKTRLAPTQDAAAPVAQPAALTPTGPHPLPSVRVAEPPLLLSPCTTCYLAAGCTAAVGCLRIGCAHCHSAG